MPSQSTFFDDHTQHSAMPAGQRYDYSSYFLTSPNTIAAMSAGVTSNFLSNNNWRSPQSATTPYTESPLGTPYSESGSADGGYYVGDVASHTVGYPESSQRTHLPDAAFAAAIYQSRFHGGISSVNDTNPSYGTQGVGNDRHSLHTSSTQFITSSEGSELPLPVSTRHGAHNHPSTTSPSAQQMSPQRLMGMTGSGFSSQTGNFSTYSSPATVQRNVTASPQAQTLPFYYPEAREMQYPPALSIYPNSSHSAIARLGEPGSPSVVPPLVFEGENGEEYEEGSECSLPSASSDTSRNSEHDIRSSHRDGSGNGMIDEWPTSPRSSAARHEDVGSPIDYDGQSPTTSPGPLGSPSLSHEQHDHGKSSKKSKMHQCNICQKWFPRPSGLATHMNSHSGARPYKCPVNGCNKSFAVRSNAKRHLRTHGIFPSTEHSSPPAQFTVGFDEPIVSDAPPVGKLPSKLRWVPQSLSSRNNVDHLKDHTSDSEDEFSTTCPVVQVPLPSVVPSLSKWDGDDTYEERNPYERLGMSPYLSSQWRGLPGPAIVTSSI